MTPDSVAELIRQMFLAAFWISAPILLVGFAAGIVMSLVQILTSIQDSAFSAIPRLIAFLVALLLLMPWMMSKTIAYATGIFANLGHYAR